MRLIVDGHSDVNLCTRQGASSLAIAITKPMSERERLDIINILISAHIDINQLDTNENAMSPLHHAVKTHNQAIIAHLFTHGAFIDIRLVNGLTTWQLYMKSRPNSRDTNYLNCGFLLINKAADVHEMLNDKNISSC